MGKDDMDDEKDDEKKSGKPFAEDDEKDDEKKSDNPFASDDDDEDEDEDEKKTKRENPFAGDDEDDPDEEEPDGDPDDKKSAERALRATLEKLAASGDKNVRLLAARATGQLNTLRGKPATSPVERMLSELRKEVGKPGSMTVSESLELLKQLS